MEAKQDHEGRPLCSRCLLYSLIEHDAKSGDETAQRIIDLASGYSRDLFRRKDFVACIVEVAETAVKSEKLVISLPEASKIAKRWKIEDPLINEAAVQLGYALAG